MRLPLLIGLHLLISAVGEALFAYQFGHNPRVIATHVLLIVEWDLALFLIVRSIASFTRSTTWAGLAFRLLLAVTCTVQVYLYALNAVSNTSWGRNMTGHLVVAFAPTVWSGREPFPLGAVGISILGVGTLLVMTIVLGLWGGAIHGTHRRLFERARLVAAAAAMVAVFGVTIKWGVDSRDDLLWTHELIASFLRPEGFAFEPGGLSVAD